MKAKQELEEKRH